MEEAGTDSQEDRRSGKSVGGGGAKKYNRPAIAKPSNHAVESSEKPKGPGKTTFAERVKLFQNLGKKPPEAAAEVASSAPEPVVPAAEAARAENSAPDEEAKDGRALNSAPAEFAGLATNSDQMKINST